MKKTLLFYITALAALLTVSCAREVMPEIRTGLKDGETGLILHVSSSAPQTKLIAPPATLNEDRLEQYYYFIYAFDPSAIGNTTKAPVFVGKWTAPLDEEGNPTVVTGTGTEENIPLDKYVDLKENENTYSGYVYIIANYKAKEADWDEILAASTPDYSTFTWDYLQNLSLPATFQDYNDIHEDTSLWPAERMDEKQDEGHRFKAQDSFVMASEVKSFSVQKGTPLPIEVKLYRLAVKVSLEVHMAKWYIQHDHHGYKYTWYSDPKRIQVYLNYAADAGTMDGTPLVYKGTGEGANAGDFFTYRRYAFLSDWTKSGDDYIFPDGSYAEKEPLKWNRKANPAETQPEGDGQYYTNDDDLVGKIVEVNGKIQYHEFTRPAYKITGTPFYSYPYDFTLDSGHAPFFKIIVEWTAMNEPEATRATDETQGSGGTPEIISHEFFYKITIPEIKVFQANQWIKLKVNLSTLGSETDEASIDVASDTYFVTNWSDPTDPDVPDITAGRYLNISSLKKDGDHPLFDMYGSKLEIPVSTSHEIEISNVSTSYEIFDSSIRTNTSIADEIRNHIRNASPYTGFLDESENSSSGYNFTLAYDAEKHIVELQHSPQTAIDALQPKDVAKITYTFTVTHKDNANFTETITVVQYPPMYIIADPNSGGTSSSTRGYVYVNMRQNTNQRWDYVRSSMSGGTDTNSNSNMYVVTVSVLESGSSNLIGDPRGSNTLTSGDPAWNSGPSTLGETRTLSSNYGRAENSTQAEITIAPKIRVASSWGAAQDYTFVNASRRCASYQEDGLPAGRWRLPTTAEIKFLVSLSSRHLLPRLFGSQSGSTTYWSSNGSVTVNTSTGDVSDTRGASDNSNTTNYIRCVYDEWYWGETTNSSPIRAQYRNTPTWGDEPR